jgi:purine nucleoside permease
MIFRLKLLVAIWVGAFASWVPIHAADRPERILRPVVVVIVYFEVGKDMGDRPGELQYWVERDHIDRAIQVGGMSRPVHTNAEGTEIAVAVRPGNVMPAVNLMALGQSSLFDLRESHWLIQGIAGIAPQDGAVGSAVWTDYVVERRSGERS